MIRYAKPPEPSGGNCTSLVPALPSYPVQMPFVPASVASSKLSETGGDAARALLVKPSNANDRPSARIPLQPGHDHERVIPIVGGEEQRDGMSEFISGDFIGGLSCRSVDCIWINWINFWIFREKANLLPGRHDIRFN